MNIRELVDDINKTLSDGKVNELMLRENRSDIERIASMVMGILTVLILTIFPIIIALELMYIAFPAFREIGDKYSVWLSQRASSVFTAGINLSDAREAVTLANLDTVGGKSSLLIYATIKVKSIFFIFFILAATLNGGSFIIEFVRKLFVGVLDKFVG